MPQRKTAITYTCIRSISAKLPDPVRTIATTSHWKHLKMPASNQPRAHSAFATAAQAAAQQEKNMVRRTRIPVHDHHVVVMQAPRTGKQSSRFHVPESSLIDSNNRAAALPQALRTKTDGELQQRQTQSVLSADPLRQPSLQSHKIMSINFGCCLWLLWLENQLPSFIWALVIIWPHA